MVFPVRIRQRLLSDAVQLSWRRGDPLTPSRICKMQPPPGALVVVVVVVVDARF